MDKRFNSNLLLAISLILLVLGVRLWGEAMKTDNWRGFTYSILHLIIASWGTYYGISRRESS